MKFEHYTERLSKIQSDVILIAKVATLLFEGFSTFFNVAEAILLVCTKKQTHVNYPLPDYPDLESYFRTRQSHPTSTNNLQFAIIHYNQQRCSHY